MKFTWIALAAGAALGTAGPATAQTDSLSATSPDGKVVIRFSTFGDQNGQQALRYEVHYRDRPVILPSPLGLAGTENNSPAVNWLRGFQRVVTARRSVTSSWTPVYGERATIPDNYNEVTITLQGKRKADLVQVEARAYNEGVAFRYTFPENIHLQIMNVREEGTTFQLPQGTTTWFTPAAQRPTVELSPAAWERDAELPVTVKLPDGVFASIAQAAQIDYPRVRLRHAGNNTLVTSLFGEVTEATPLRTPWRVVLVADTPGALLENNYIILNLNDTLALTDTDWIKPGIAMREVTLSTDGAKRLVDFAVEQEIDYIHFDAGWYGHEYEVASDARTVNVDPRRNPKGDLDLHEAIRYATAKGRKVMLYVNHRALERQLDSLLPLYRRWGVAGIKFGFVHTGSHRWTTWLHDAVRKAAAHQLVVDIHDEYRPTGFSRTYPNLLTQEGIHGNEEFPDATQNTMLPFTRFIAGAADYTFCFNAWKVRPERTKTTNGHQLALPVIYYSPLQFLYWYGKPEHYPDKTDIEFWKGIPTVWDETRVIQGYPGKFVAIARRKGQEWYVGVITNTEEREVKVELDFLPGGEKFSAVVYEDRDKAEGESTILKSTRRVTSGTTLTFRLKGSGGAAVRIAPEPPRKRK